MSSAILKSFNWCGPSIQKLCDADNEFSKYLIGQTQAQRQCLAFVVLGWERSGSSRLSAKELGVKIRSQSKKALLRLFFQPCPAGLGVILKKLGNRIMIKKYYLDLIDLLAEPNAAKFLWHEAKIQPFMIAALVRMEPVFRRPSIVRNMANESVLNSLKYAIAVAHKISPEDSNFVLARSLEKKLARLQKKVMESFEMSCFLQEWLARRLKKTAIPAPPWEGTCNLRPITDCRGILKTATDFENCLNDELAKVIGKKRYFYIWKGRGAAVVALDNEPLLGWIVGEIKGPNNKAVSKQTTEKIIRELNAAGIEEYQGMEDFSLYD